MQLSLPPKIANAGARGIAVPSDRRHGAAENHGVQDAKAGSFSIGVNSCHCPIFHCNWILKFIHQMVFPSQSFFFSKLYFPILSPVGESCVAIPRVGSLEGNSIRIHERVWDRERFIVTGSTFWPFFDQKMAKNVPNENAPIFLKIWSGVLWVGYRHLPKREN